LILKNIILNGLIEDLYDYFGQGFTTREFFSIYFTYVNLDHKLDL